MSIVHVDDKDWMLTSSFYIGQGFATLQYEVFSLNPKGEKDILDTQSAEFEITQEDAADAYQEFQTSLSKYMEDGILIIACDIDLEEQFVRTKETPCVPRNYYDIVFTKFEEQAEETAEEQTAGSAEESAPVEVPMAENRVPDLSAVASIIVTNGDTGEEKSFNRADSSTAFNDLLDLYDQLDFVADFEENTGENARIGYKYCMKLQDAEGNMIQTVTPYKDGFTIDSTFYKYNGRIHWIFLRLI